MVFVMRQIFRRSTAQSIKIHDTASDRIFMIFSLCDSGYGAYCGSLSSLVCSGASVSDSRYVNSGAMLFLPKGFTFMGYELAFRDNRILIGYGNTLIYTVFGTLLATSTNVLAGYALSRKDLPGRNFLMLFFVFIMYFSGGLIPFYMVVQSLHLINTRWILILLGGTSVYNIIITRSFFMSSIPIELFEAASMEGCGNGRFFFSIVLPLSKAIIAVIALYCAVGQWNAYFNAMIFLTDQEQIPPAVVFTRYSVGWKIL